MLRSESYKRGALLSVIFNGLAKGILFLLTIVIAAYFGNSIRTDIYFFIYSTMILFSALVNVMDIVVVVPESMRIRVNEGEAAAMAFLNYFFRLYIIIGVLFVVAMLVFGTKLFGIISRFSEADIRVFKEYFFIGSFYFLFQVVTAYINNILTSLKYFTIPMIISGINSCIIIVGIVLLHRQFDVLTVLISGIAAYAVNLVILLVILKRSMQWNFFTRSATVQKRVWHNIFFAGLGQLATLASNYFPLYLLSGFGSGIISSMSYGKNIADIPNTLVTSQLATVSGIKLNEEVARKDKAGINDTFTRTAKLMIYILVPVGLFLFVLAKPVITVFYQTAGFSEAATAQAAVFLQLLSVTVFSIAVNALVTRLFIAVQAIKQAFIYQVIMNVFLLAATWLFMHYYGAYGYGYAVITANGANFLLMYFICRQLARSINYAAIIKYAAVIILINGLIATAVFFIVPALQLPAVTILLLCFAGWSVLLLLFGHVFQLNKDILFILGKTNRHVV